MARKKTILIVDDHPLVREGLKSIIKTNDTFENHRTKIMNKLGLHSSLELVRYAAKLGIIDIDLWKE